jgi:hypothetical protein
MKRTRSTRASRVGTRASKKNKNREPFIWKFHADTTTTAPTTDTVFHVIMEKSITTIHKKAFSTLRYLENVNILNTVLTVEDYAFENCTCLPCLDIPQSVTKIGNYVFQNVHPYVPCQYHHS